MPKTDKYKTYRPPASVAKAADAGLKLRHFYGYGGTLVGLKRAHQLASRTPISAYTIIRMNRFFDRHQKNRNNAPPKRGMIAWLLWGGDPGRKWAEKIFARIKKL